MCTLAYAPAQLFDLAADIERYPEFLPGYFATRVTKREGNVYFSDQVVGFGTFRKRFGSKTELSYPGRIDVTSGDRLFRRFNITWYFDALPGGGCRVTLDVDLELRSRLVQDIFSRSVDRIADSAMSAFKARADRLYGPRTCTGAMQ
jgi:coenzyme Q-binding protein COQ10